MSFSEEKVAERLSKLNATEGSIISTSQWLLFHYRNAKTIVDIWNAKFQNPAVSSGDKLTLYYLCNDLIQSARKNPKHSIFLKEFTDSLPESLKIVSKSIDEPIKLKFKKVIKIWQDRQVFSQRVIDGLFASIDVGGRSIAPTSRATAEPGTMLDSQRKLPKKPVKDTDDYDPEKEVAPELIPVNMIFNTISQASLNTSTDFQTMSKKYSLLFKAEHLPAPHKFIKELNDLVHKNNKLVESTNSLTQMRTDLISNLQKLLDRQKDWLRLEELRLEKLQEMNQNVTEKKTELEELIKDVASTTSDTSINDSKINQDDDEDMPTYVYDDEAEKNEVTNDENDEIIMPSYTAEKEDDEEDDDEMPGYKNEEEENAEEPSPIIDNFSNDEEDESSPPPKKKAKYSDNKANDSDEYDPIGNDDQPVNADLASILFKLT